MIRDDDFKYFCRCFGKYRRDRVQRNSFPRKYKCVCCGRRFEVQNFEDYVRSQYYLGRDKRGKIRRVCWGCSLDHKLKLATATLYHLVSAIPVAWRDSLGVYPNEVAVPVWQNPEWRRKQNKRPRGLRDYAEPGPVGIRQQAASSVQDVLSHLIGVPAIDTRWALYLTPPETQQTLKRLGRIYVIA